MDSVLHGNIIVANIVEELAPKERCNNFGDGQNDHPVCPLLIARVQLRQNLKKMTKCTGT